MVMNWIMRNVKICQVFSLLYFWTVLSLPPVIKANDDVPRPLIISLPINVQASMPIQPYNTEDNSEEEEPGEQRLVPRTYDPFTDNEYQQEDNSDSNTNSNQRSNFLTWNPGDKFMVLQINDYIGARTQDPNDSEESEKTEDFKVRKRNRGPPIEDAFDFEDYRRLPSQSRRRIESSKKTRISSSKRTKRPMREREERNYSEEDTESDVYGTDPVVHYMRDKKRKNRRTFDFGPVPQDDDSDDFIMRKWWNY